MSFYRLPAITAADTQGQLRQLRSYLYQLVEELNHTAPQTAAQVSLTQAPVQSPGEVFAGIKGLIIKSADIVDSYYDRMESRLSGSYVAKSDFGTYSEQTDQRITEHSAAIERNFTHVQQVTDAMADMERILIGVDAYINSGLLYYEEGVPVYGIEVGQRTQVNGAQVFRKYARFASNRLSFYDHNDNEVAYISDQTLSITNAQVRYAYRMGHLVDTVQSDGSIVTKYAAGQ